MLRFLTAGESHGKGLVVVLEGMVAGLGLSEDFINRQLRRRQWGYGRGERMKIEKDEAEIISGVRHGKTMGSPISLLIKNRDWENWKESMSISPVEGNIEPLTRLRPGHADLPGTIKYHHRDIRPVLERASARETVARVAAGAIAERFLEEFGISISSYTLAVGCHRIESPVKVDWEKLDSSLLRCPDREIEKAMVAEIDSAMEAGDTLGGIFQVIATGVPIGLGSHTHWDRRLSGRLSQAVMSINAVKGVEIGDGFDIAVVNGSEAHDVIKSPSESGGSWGHRTNHAGGLEGGISNGEEITIRCAVKPIATMKKPLPSVDLITGKVIDAHYERSDVCIVPAAGVIGEAMVALVLADAVLEKFGGDNLVESLHHYQGYLNMVSLMTPGEK
ncbi:chorismate synthase [Chloroflexota bacterium]